MLNNINGHTIDIEKLSKCGWVLDLGSRDLIFSKKMLLHGLNVISVDPCKDIDVENIHNLNFINKACVGIKNTSTMKYYSYQDWGANSLYNKNSAHMIVQNKPSDLEKSYDVEIITITEIMEQFGIDQFELIKIDIEGGEYDILLNFPNKCTKQLSVEFHDWLGLNPYTNVEDFYNLIENDILSEYDVKFKNRVPMSNSFTYSDVLYILK